MSPLAIIRPRVAARRLLALGLVFALAVAAVPALASCCADHCHDDGPHAAVDPCECDLRLLELPQELLTLPVAGPVPLAAPAGNPAGEDAISFPAVADPRPAAPPPSAPDRTTVLRI